METLSIGAFTIGITQLLKKSGMVSGNLVQIVSIAVGAAATYLSLYQPELWGAISEFAIGLTATGLVSFGIEMKER